MPHGDGFFEKYPQTLAREVIMSNSYRYQYAHLTAPRGWTAERKRRGNVNAKNGMETTTVRFNEASFRLVYKQNLQDRVEAGSALPEKIDREHTKNLTSRGVELCYTRAMKYSSALSQSLGTAIMLRPQQGQPERRVLQPWSPPWSPPGRPWRRWRP